jgi:preprotein translocase subunit YajC
VQNLFADPFSLVMLALIGVLIIFMVRNGRKRQAAMAQLQSGLVPGAEVMLQSGIYATVEEIDEEDNRITVRSGTSTLVVHRNAVSTIVSPIDAVADSADTVAPDDDPAFGEHYSATNAAEVERAGDEDAENSQFPSPFNWQANDKIDNDDTNGDASPKA